MIAPELVIITTMAIIGILYLSIADKSKEKVLALTNFVSPTKRALVVSDIIKETAETITLHLLDKSGRAISFAAGQYLTLNTKLDGKTICRSYSFSSSSNVKGAISITIKRVKDGVISNWLHDQTEIGDELSVHLPAGKFVVPRFNKKKLEFVFIAGGSGITPIYSMLVSLLESDEPIKLHLIYGNNAIQDVIFHEDLTALEKKSEGRLTIKYVLNLAPDGWDSQTGVLNQSTCSKLLKQYYLSNKKSDACFICGPAIMMEAAKKALLQQGVDEEYIFNENFLAPQLNQEPSDDSNAKGLLVTFSNLQEKEQQLTVPTDKTILESAISAKLAVPYSCMSGDCGSCKVKVLSGKVRMKRGSCLSQEDRAEGYILSCMAKPLEELRLELCE